MVVQAAARRHRHARGPARQARRGQGDRARLQRGEARARRASRRRRKRSIRAADDLKRGDPRRQRRPSGRRGVRDDRRRELRGLPRTLAPFGRMVDFGIASREQNEVATGHLLRQLTRSDRLLAHASRPPPRRSRGDDRRPARTRSARASSRSPSAASIRFRRCARPTRTSPPGGRAASCCWTPRRDDVRRARAQSGPPARARGARLHRADADPGAGDPGAARRPGRDRPGADGHRQDRRLRTAAAAVPRSGLAGDAGDRADADSRALHPGDPGAARLRRAPRHRDRRRLRRRPDRDPAVAAAQGRPRRRRHRRADDGPDLAPLAGAHLGPLRRPRRGRRDARPRLHRGRREDPADVSVGAPDGAVLGDDAGADRAPRRGAHVRPGDDLDHARSSSPSTRSSRPTSRSSRETRPSG